MKKGMLWFSVFSLLLCLLSGCSGTENSSLQAGESSSVQSTPSGSGIGEESSGSGPAGTQTSSPSSDARIRSFTCLGTESMSDYFLMADTLEQFYAWQQLEKLMERKNIELVPEFISSEEYQVVLQTRFASLTDLPMFCYGGLSEEEIRALGQDGSVLDISNILAKSSGTASAFFDENPFGIMAAAQASENGHMWWIPDIAVSEYNGQYGRHASQQGVCIRRDWLEALELDMPTTLDEYTQVLRAFHQAGMSGLGTEDAGGSAYAGCMTDLTDGMAGWFGLVRGLVNVFWESGRAVSPWEQTTFEEYITYIQGLYEEGLIDPSLNRKEGAVRARAILNEVGALTLYGEDVSLEPMIHAPLDENGQPTACFVEIAPFSAAGNVMPAAASDPAVVVWDRFLFTSALTDLQLGADFLDVLYSEEGQTLMNWGVEGINFQTVEGQKQFRTGEAVRDGTSVQFLLDGSFHDIQEKSDLRVCFGQQLYGGSLLPLYSFHSLSDDLETLKKENPWAEPKIAAFEASLSVSTVHSYIDLESALSLNAPEDVSAYEKLYGPVSDLSEQYLAQLITGEASVEDIPAMLSSLQDAGLDDLISFVQDRYDKLYKNR